MWQTISGSSGCLTEYLDSLDGIGRVDRIMLGLIGLNEGYEYIQPIAFRRTRLRAPQALDLRERGLAITLRADRA